ncbi:7084_t:CDS:2 [Acaulospora colombiana]|uniref:7084_t:CDS:1 n=1 Tax=Acaulospora colombiana TaxID=27376 RepID=A0ACA9KC97_9GLOM|nr:7084_t:CDS:2 [Acaulospora colombiana]
MQSSKRQRKLIRKQLQYRNAQSSTYSTNTPFRAAERNFKSRLPPPDFNNVIDFYNIDNCCEEIKSKIVEVELKADLDEEYGELFGSSDGIENVNMKKAYCIKDLPGFIFIRNPFTPEAQKNIVKRCLEDFTRKPNLSNLDTHYVLPKQGIWELHERAYKGQLNEEDDEFFVPLKATSIEENTERCIDDNESSPILQLKDQKEDSSNINSNMAQCLENKESSNLNEEKTDPPPSSTVPILPPSELIRKLRWVTLGYQYHWPTKTYHLDRRFDFPKDINYLAKAVVRSVDGIGLPDGSFIHRYDVAKWKSEAGVINYYQLKDNLMAHVDRSEINMDAPLISFRSLDLKCVHGFYISILAITHTSFVLY